MIAESTVAVPPPLKLRLATEGRPLAAACWETQSRPEMLESAGDVSNVRAGKQLNVHVGPGAGAEDG